MPTRRQTLASIGILATSGIALSQVPDNSTAVDVSVQELSIPDSKNEITNPVTSAQLSVSGEYTIDAEVVPNRVICRLEAKRSTPENYTQLAASEPSQSLSKEFTESFDYQGNLLDCPEITAPDLSPANVGESKSLDVDIRLRLVVKDENSVLSEETVSESSTITAEKTQADVSLGVDADGSISVSDG